MKNQSERHSTIAGPGGLALAALCTLAACGGGTDVPATPQTPQLALGSVVGETSIDATTSDVVYKIQYTNGPSAVNRGVLVLSDGGGSRIVNGVVHLGDLQAGARTEPSETVTIRQARGAKLDVASLQWSVASLDSAPSVANRAVPAANLTIGEADCSVAKIGGSIDKKDILEPVSSVTLAAPTWVRAAGALPAYCRVDGSLKPVDPAAPDIKFAVAMPSSWAFRAVQIGGAGNNGVIPNLASAEYLNLGWATLGSDSGHQDPDVTWTLSDESAKNYGYMQLKKTHDAAWVILQRLYGLTPIYSYFIGGSQGGREALTVAQRYPLDYDGIVATVPIVSLSNINLSRALIRTQERATSNWVTAAKRNATAAEVINRCDGLDGLLDGIVNNYMGCRALFDVTRGERHPWIGKRCPNNIDPNPSDTSVNACLTDGQMETLEFMTRRYLFSEPLAHGTTSFGMFMPSIDMTGNQLTVATRFKTQEGAAVDAVSYSLFSGWTGGPSLAGTVFGNLSAEVLDYVEGGAQAARRKTVSEWWDSTNPDLSGFLARGGRLIVQSGAADSRASPGAQLDYYESVLQKMGRSSVDQFARIYVSPQGGHGLTGSAFQINADGASTGSPAIPSTIDRTQLISDWVEKAKAPDMAPTMTGANNSSMVLCSYPKYPKYRGNGLATNDASSYDCVE